MIRVFEGIEAEGQYKGLRTLFVSGDVPLDTILFYFDSGRQRQVYFGADNLSLVNWDTIKRFVDLVRKDVVIVTVETSSPIPATVANWIHVVFKINGLNEKDIEEVLETVPVHRCQIKFDSVKCSHLIPAERVIWNLRSDILGDKELWRQDEVTSK